MGGQSSKEAVEKALKDFSPTEREHLLALFDRISQQDPKHMAIDEAAFSEFCKLLPDAHRITLYRAVIKYSKAAHPGNKDLITKPEFFSAIQAIIRGSVDEKADFLFDWCGEGGASIAVPALENFVGIISSKAIGLHPIRRSEKNVYSVSAAFIDLVINKPYQEKPSYLSGELSIGKKLDHPLSKVEFVDWYQKNPLFQKLVELIFIRMFLRPKDIFKSASSPNLFDNLEASRKLKRERGLNPPILDDDTNLLTSEDVWLISMHIPKTCRHHWKLLYSDALHGKSWSKFSMQIIDKGATLLVVQDDDDHVFGAFALEGLKKTPSFYGSPENFLFSFAPTKGIYGSSGLNQNFQYFNSSTKTLPNGLGYGGQFNFFGLLINEDFETGHSKAKPLSTTYNSPRLSGKEEFAIKHAEVWCLLEPVRDPNREDPNQSILDSFKEDQVILEMNGRVMHSKNLRPEKDEQVDELSPVATSESLTRGK